eukprot:scaffold53945_cov75-Phaeocystis_antarctica.AAC.7
MPPCALSCQRMYTRAQTSTPPLAASCRCASFSCLAQSHLTEARTSLVMHASCRRTDRPLFPWTSP